MGQIVDISQFKNVTDWDALNKAADAVILRIGYTYSRPKDLHICVDHKYAEYRRQCETRRIPFGLYYFTDAITVDEAVKEADFVAHECKGISNFILPVFCDTERVDGLGRADNLSKEQRTACVKAFCSRLQAWGIPAGIYASDSWLTENLDMSQLPFSVWVASWRTDRPRYSNYVLWQYTSKGSIPGIEGDVDLSTRDNVFDDPIQRVTDIELAEIKYLEKKDGNLNYLYTKDKNIGNANFSKYGYEMHKLQPSNMDYPAAWCMAFQSWAFVQAFGLAEAKRMLCGDIEDYCPFAARRFRNAGRWFTTPAVGDLVFFGTPGNESHVGRVYQISGGMIRTIEGNTSLASGVETNGGGVWSKSYPLNEKRIVGYGRPMY